MKKRKGSGRIAYVFPRLGIVVKVARIANPFRLAASLMRTGRVLGWRRAWRDLMIPMSKLGSSPRYRLFGGIIANLREWMISWSTRHPLLAPTYFTLGFVNVQRAAAELPTGIDREWGRRLCRATGVRTVGELGDAHLLGSENFGVLNGHPCIVDYGGSGTRRFLCLHGDTLYRAVDLVSPP